jgi:hypothetical protein
LNTNILFYFWDNLLLNNLQTFSEKSLPWRSTWPRQECKCGFKTGELNGANARKFTRLLALRPLLLPTTITITVTLAIILETTTIVQTHHHLLRPHLLHPLRLVLLLRLSRSVINNSLQPLTRQVLLTESVKISYMFLNFYSWPDYMFLLLF